ncbi:MAG: tRNA-queuosine alpha-mannosyltransferase domain-containing protein [Pontibacterium sp.]
MKILLLSAYDAASHIYWRKGLVEQFPEHEWQVLTLPPRYFSWRIRGNSLSWALGEKAVLQQPYDLIVATSMTDLSALKGLVPALSQIPTVLYFHENQFAYPESGREYGSVEPKILNLYSALAADKVLFNTGYNRDTFLEGCRKLLKKLPDQVPPGIVDMLAGRSVVLPVPLPDSVFCLHQSEPGPLQVVWNHRWEFDKGPELLYAAMAALAANNVPVKFHIVGQQFRHSPPVFEKIKAEFSALIGHQGFVESTEAYRVLLQQSDVVLSTALHDFQGIAVLEAVAAGALPLVPDRLAYPELFPEGSCYNAGADETPDLVRRLTGLVVLKAQQNLPVAPCVKHLTWSRLRPAYAEVFSTLRS